MMSRKLNGIAIIVVLITLLSQVAFSESLMSLRDDGLPTAVQINIDQIDFNATTGGSDEKSFYLYNNGIFTENVTIRNFQGKAGEWLKIDKDVTLSPNEPSHRVAVVLKVPSDVDPGIYLGTFEVASSEHMRVVKVTANVRQKQAITSLTPLGIGLIAVGAVIAMFFISNFFFKRQEKEIDKIRRKRHEATGA